MFWNDLIIIGNQSEAVYAYLHIVDEFIRGLGTVSFPITIRVGKNMYILK